MRAYTLSILSRLANTGNPIVEKEIVQWVNKKLSEGGKTTSLRGFQDSAIADGKIVIDLIDSIKKGCINYDNVKEGGNAEVITKTTHLLLNIILDETECKNETEMTKGQTKF